MNSKNIQIREAKKSDFDDVMKIEKEAFGQEDEAELVSQLLEDKSAEPVISLLAFKDDEAAGHILFTRATFEANEHSPSGSQSTTPLIAPTTAPSTAPSIPPSIYILAPLAVKPEYQRQGIGGMLINAGLKKLKEIGVEMVFVLGHMDYYPRYGFIPDAGSLGFATPYPIPDEHADAWMVQALTSEGLSKVTGKMVCADALNKPEYWIE